MVFVMLAQNSLMALVDAQEEAEEIAEIYVIVYSK